MGGDQTLNVAGRVIGGLAALSALRSPGGLLQLLAARNALLGDPTTRAGLGPFSAGLLQVGGGRADAPERLRAGGGIPQDIEMLAPGQAPGSGDQWTPSLPPLSPEKQLEEQKFQLVNRVMQGGTLTSEDRQKLRVLGVDIPMTLEEQLGSLGDDGRFLLGGRYRPTLGGSVAEPAIGFKEIGEEEFNLSDPADAERYAITVGNIRAAGRTVVERPTTRGTVIVKDAPRDPNAITPEARRLFDQLFGGGGARGPAPSPTAPPAETPAPSSPPPSALADDLAVDALPLVEPEGAIGYPSGAFDPGGAPASTSAVPFAQPAPGQLPAGTRATMKLGPLSVSKSGPPVAGAASGEVQRSLSLLLTGAQAAEAAKQQLLRGPQAKLTLPGVGESPVQPGALTGPVSGRMLTTGVGLPFTEARIPGLQSLSGQPLAQEASDLNSRFASARLGVVAILGSQMTGRELEIVDALMPSPTLPTEINVRRLERLGAFFKAAAGMQSSLANLTPEQQKALMLPMFQGIMSDAVPTPAPASGGVLDLR